MVRHAKASAEAPQCGALEKVDGHRGQVNRFGLGENYGLGAAWDQAVMPEILLSRRHSASSGVERPTYESTGKASERGTPLLCRLLAQASRDDRRWQWLGFTASIVVRARESRVHGEGKQVVDQASVKGGINRGLDFSIQI